MKIRKIFMVVSVLLVFILVYIAFSKPASAMPPPASRLWMWQWLQGEPTSQMVKVNVSWLEGNRQENLEMKTILKDVR